MNSHYMTEDSIRTKITFVNSSRLFVMFTEMRTSSTEGGVFR